MRKIIFCYFKMVVFMQLDRMQAAWLELIPLEDTLAFTRLRTKAQMIADKFVQN